MRSRIRAATDPLVDSVGGSERRRVLVALGVPFLFWLAVELAADLGFLPLVLAVGLAAYLYTRRTALETLAAGAAGAGVLTISLALLRLYWVGARGSTEPLADAATRLSGWFLAGALLIAVGYWLYRAGRTSSEASCSGSEDEGVSGSERRRK